MQATATKFTLVQKVPVTTALCGPFWLSITAVSLQTKTKRKKFACAYRALQALKDAKLTDKHYGADVCDSNGTELACRDFDR